MDEENNITGEEFEKEYNKFTEAFCDFGIKNGDKLPLLVQAEIFIFAGAIGVFTQIKSEAEASKFMQDVMIEAIKYFRKLSRVKH